MRVLAQSHQPTEHLLVLRVAETHHCALLPTPPDPPALVNELRDGRRQRPQQQLPSHTIVSLYAPTPTQLHTTPHDSSRRHQHVQRPVVQLGDRPFSLRRGRFNGNALTAQRREGRVQNTPDIYRIQPTHQTKRPPSPRLTHNHQRHLQLRGTVLYHALQQRLELLLLLVLLRPHEVVSKRGIQTLDVRHGDFDGVQEVREDGRAEVVGDGGGDDDPLKTGRGDGVHEAEDRILEVRLHELIGFVQHDGSDNVHQRKHCTLRIILETRLHSLS